MSFARAHAPRVRSPGLFRLKCGKSQPTCVSGIRGKSNLPALIWNHWWGWELPGARRLAADLGPQTSDLERVPFPFSSRTFPGITFPQHEDEFPVTSALALIWHNLQGSFIDEVAVMSISYRDLRVWQSSMKLVLNIYKVTQNFPRSELYGLVNQMRRAAVSVPSNIAEGKGRLTDPDRLRFFSQARGSLLELETQIVIAEQLRYIPCTEAKNLIQSSGELGRMLNALIASIRPERKFARAERAQTCDES